jgi:hypothetical protein
VKNLDRLAVQGEECVFLLVATCLITVAMPWPASSVSVDTPIKTAVGKSLPLLLKGAQGHVAQRTCFACHNQAIPIFAFTMASQRGFSIDQAELTKQAQFIHAFLKGNEDNYRKGKGQGGDVATAGYALLALELGQWKPDATTEGVIEYLLQRDKDLDHWRTTSKRPPSEASHFTTNYLALRALRKWGTSRQQERIAKRIDVVQTWLSKTSAQDTEDRAFRLWALHLVGTSAKELLPAVQDLLRSQRADGGWGQTGAMDSDAYATGSALVALCQTRGIGPTEPSYRRGVAFLLRSQEKDGSWLVHSRSQPFQTYYESGFPHGKDQFISIAATGWATTALVLALPLSPNQLPE